MTTALEPAVQITTYATELFASQMEIISLSLSPYLPDPPSLSVPLSLPCEKFRAINFVPRKRGVRVLNSQSLDCEAEPLETKVFYLLTWIYLHW